MCPQCKQYRLWRGRQEQEDALQRRLALAGFSPNHPRGTRALAAPQGMASSIFTGVPIAACRTTSSHAPRPHFHPPSYTHASNRLGSPGHKCTLQGCSGRPVSRCLHRSTPHNFLGTSKVSLQGTPLAGSPWRQCSLIWVSDKECKIAGFCPQQNYKLVLEAFSSSRGNLKILEAAELPRWVAENQRPCYSTSSSEQR